jgi:hypothetical protein
MTLTFARPLNGRERNVPASRERRRLSAWWVGLLAELQTLRVRYARVASDEDH